MQIALQVFGEHEKLRPSQWHSGRSNASRLNALAKCVCQQPEFMCCLFLFVVRQGSAGLWPIPKLAGNAADLFSPFLVFVNDRARKVVQFVTEV